MEGLSTNDHENYSTQMENSTDVWSPPSDVSAKKIVTGSLLEQMILCFYFTVCVIFVPSVNSFIIHVVRKTDSLQTPQYFFICCYALCDLLYSLTAHTFHLAAVIMNFTTIPAWLCRLHGVLHAGVLFSSSHALGLIAYERYCCFFRPLTYAMHFSKTRMVVLAVVPHVTGQSFSAFIDLYVGRQYFTAVLACNSAGPALVYFNPIVICYFYLPSAMMTLVCLIKLIFLVKRQTIATVPNENTTGHYNHTLYIRKTVKIILLVSGTFWGTSVPAFIGRTAIFSTGATWADMDTRRDMTAYVVSRTFNLMLSTVSALINPIIYLTVHKELRNGCQNMLKGLFKTDN